MQYNAQLLVRPEKNADFFKNTRYYNVEFNMRLMNICIRCKDALTALYISRISRGRFEFPKSLVLLPVRFLSSLSLILVRFPAVTFRNSRIFKGVRYEFPGNRHDIKASALPFV